MLEIKNEGDIPIDIVLSPIQHRDDTTRISIPIKGSFSSNVKSGCTKYLQITKLDEKGVFWEGVIPTCISQPIVVDVERKEVNYSGIKIPSLVKKESILSYFTNSTPKTILLAIVFLVIGVWLYKKYKR